jgi:hypothetical protein
VFWLTIEGVTGARADCIVVKGAEPEDLSQRLKVTEAPVQDDADQPKRSTAPNKRKERK